MSDDENGPTPVEFEYREELEILSPDDLNKTVEHTPLDLCNNGPCRTPQTREESMTPEPKIEWADITIAGGDSLLGRVVGRCTVFGMPAVEMTHTTETGRVVSTYIPLDAINSVIPITEADVTRNIEKNAAARRMQEVMLSKFHPPKAASGPARAPTVLCTNGTCTAPQDPACSNLHCKDCCEEKCAGECVRAVKQSLGADAPSF